MAVRAGPVGVPDPVEAGTAKAFDDALTELDRRVTAVADGVPTTA